MSPSQEGFGSELSKGIASLVLAYDEQEITGQCVIYLKANGQKIIVEAAVIKEEREEAISVLRAKIREGIGDASSLTLALKGGALVFEPGEPIT